MAMWRSARVLLLLRLYHCIARQWERKLRAKLSESRPNAEVDHSNACRSLLPSFLAAKTRVIPNAHGGPTIICPARCLMR